MSEPHTQSSRDRILIAAATMIGENPAARLSVRAVAERAGVSTGSLRHHFPTQRALLDAVLEGIYRHVAPDDPIRDATRPPRDRLVDSLRQVLAPLGTGTPAREAWRRATDPFLVAEPTPAAVDAYRALDAQGNRRIEHWLALLAEEGAIDARDIDRHVRFLGVVLSGLSLQRALPTEQSILQTETETLYAAVDAVLGASEPRHTAERPPHEAKA